MLRLPDGSAGRVPFLLHLLRRLTGLRGSDQHPLLLALTHPALKIERIPMGKQILSHPVQNWRVIRVAPKIVELLGIRLQVVELGWIVETIV